MSRITGILFKDDIMGQKLAERMLQTFHSSRDWSSASTSTDNAHFGWTGWHEPNITSSNGIIVVVDGSIFNKDDFGYHNTEAELLIELYLKHGFEDSVVKLNGDFAIALYDQKNDTLWLARDRLGIKPLYYAMKPAYFAFASQPRALLTLPGITQEINREFVALFAVSHYRYFDNNPEKSAYKDIMQLPAGNVMRITNGNIFKNVYWKLREMPDHTYPEAQLAEQYRDLLKDSVSLRIKYARDPAFTLSGGMDSSSILASVVDITGKKQHAFSTLYVDKTYDESEEIESMLNKAVIQWHTVTIGNPDIFGIVQRMIAAHDEPVATATWLSHFLLCEEASKKGFSSLFGGLGGDELNAGEFEYFFFYFADLKVMGLEQRLSEEIEKWIEYHNHPVFIKNRTVAEDSISRLVDLNKPGKCLADKKRLLRYASALNPEFFDLFTYEPAMDHPFNSYLKNRTYQDIFRETVPCCLRAEDRQTIAFNLNNFLPFFDYRLVEFMFRIPGDLKICKGITKILLREAMRGILPEETRTRIKKTGWNAPAHLWFSGKGRENIMDLINSTTFRQWGIYNVKEVERLLNEHDQIASTRQLKENHMMFFWQVVNLELWLQSVDNWKSSFEKGKK